MEHTYFAETSQQNSPLEWSEKRCAPKSFAHTNERYVRFPRVGTIFLHVLIGAHTCSAVWCMSIQESMKKRLMCSRSILPWFWENTSTFSLWKGRFQRDYLYSYLLELDFIHCPFHFSLFISFTDDRYRYSRRETLVETDRRVWAEHWQTV